MMLWRNDLVSQKIMLFGEESSCQSFILSFGGSSCFQLLLEGAVASNAVSSKWEEHVDRDRRTPFVCSPSVANFFEETLAYQKFQPCKLRTTRAYSTTYYVVVPSSPETWWTHTTHTASLCFTMSNILAEFVERFSFMIRVCAVTCWNDVPKDPHWLGIVRSDDQKYPSSFLLELVALARYYQH